MEYTKLGRTGFEVTRIRLGCRSYGGGKWGQSCLEPRRGGEPTVHQARARSPINFFDTANRYVPHAVVGFV
jgi:aryl-alcohol dehydrogenase-like predicted oxidoreductase